jgi:hypothetical protein
MPPDIALDSVRAPLERMADLLGRIAVMSYDIDGALGVAGQGMIDIRVSAGGEYVEVRGTIAGHRWADKQFEGAMHFFDCEDRGPVLITARELAMLVTHLAMERPHGEFDPPMIG